MDITVIGRGALGGGLAELWERAGHRVLRLGREGGDVGDAEAVLLAVPGSAVEAALSSVTGLSGRSVVDATNLYGGTRPPAGFDSNAAYVQSVTGGVVVKAFSTNFASLFGRVAGARVRPSNLWSGDVAAGPLVTRLSLDAGYEAVRLGDLDMAATQEALAGTTFAIAQAGLGEFVYRLAPPEQL